MVQSPQPSSPLKPQKSRGMGLLVLPLVVPDQLSMRGTSGLEEEMEAWE